MLNEDDLRPGDVIQDAMGDFWHVHDDGKIWCSEPGARISFETANGSCGPFTYPLGYNSKQNKDCDSEDDSVKDEGKWTRDDLPEPSRLSRLKHEIVKDFFWEDILDEIADHLNAHYSKTEHRLLSSAAECVLGAEDRVRSAKAERDAAIARAEQLEKKLAKAMSDYQDVEDERDEWNGRVDQLRDERDDAVQSCMAVGRERDKTRKALEDERIVNESMTTSLFEVSRQRDDAVIGRDEWKARAEQAEQLIPAYAMLDVWLALGRDSIHFDDWYDERGYADAWAELSAAVREATEARTSPAVARADIEKVVEAVFDREAGYDYGSDKPWPGTEPVSSAVWDYLKGTDPAVYVVRESDIPVADAAGGNMGKAYGLICCMLFLAAMTSAVAFMIQTFSGIPHARRKVDRSQREYDKFIVAEAGL